MCGAVVQTSFRVDHFVEHPGGCTAAYDEFDVVAVSGPIIPKMLQCAHKLGASCVEPRQFVEKQNFGTFFCFMLNVFLKLMESLSPSFWHLGFFGVIAQGVMEVFQLFFGVGVFFSCHSEGKLPFEQLFHKEGLADTTSAIDGNKFRFPACQIFLQLGDLFFATDDIVFHT